MLKYLDELESEDLKGKRVLLRLDLNVAIENGKVFDDFDLQKIIPTVDFLREKEARTIIIAHIEDSNGDATTLLPVLDYLNGYFKTEFCPTYFTPESVEKLLALQDKGVLLFENLRVNEGEKKNDPEFTKKLSQMADIYVNDAFGVCHRQHASIVGVPEFLPHYAGLLMRQEIEHLSRAFKPEHPFVFVLGGAKFETKLPVIKKYLEKADTVFVAGALTNDIFKARGLEVGTSLVSSGEVDEKVLTNPKIITPVDVTVTNSSGDVSFKTPEEVTEDECIVDVGPETINQLQTLLDGAKTLVWNGPLGNYEIGFKDKTESFAEIVAELTTQNGLESIIGGGDTVASINTLGLDHKFTFISTGGGAMLDYLVNENLPGIEALEK
jgi:phosphoglycerate kinase